MQAPWNEQHSFDPDRDMDESARQPGSVDSVPNISSLDILDTHSELWDDDSALGSDRT